MLPDLASRIERLEKSNRRLRVAAYGVPALAGLALLLGAGNPENLKVDAITTKDLLIVGGPGSASIMLVANDDGANMVIADAENNTRAAISFDTKSGGLFILKGQSGAEIIMRTNDASLGNKPGGNRGDATLSITSPGERKSDINLTASEAMDYGGIVMNGRNSGKSVKVGYDEHGVFENTAAQDRAKDEPKETPEQAEARKEAEADAAKAKADKAGIAAVRAEADHNEKSATSMLLSAYGLLKSEKREAYRSLLKDIVKKYPDTKSAEEARKLLK